MKVYTFSTGGNQDGYYLEKLSSTKEGVKKLLRDYLEEYYLHEDETIREIFIDDKRITVVIDDIRLEELEIKYSDERVFELVAFDVL